MSNFSNGLREILTRATVAKGQKNYRQRHVLLTDYRPENILGYTCKNHIYAAEPGPDYVEVKGRYDIHIWYGFNGDQTAVMKEVIHYTEYVPVVNLEGCRLGSHEEATVEVIKEPMAVDAYIKNHEEICVVVEMMLYAQITGDTKLWVKVYDEPMEWEKKEYFDEEGFDFEFEELAELEFEEPR